MLAVSKNIIAHKEGLMVTSGYWIKDRSEERQYVAVVLNQPDTAEVVLHDYEALVEKTITSIQHHQHSEGGIKKWYKEIYSLWDEFKKDHRHVVLVFVTSEAVAHIVDVDNLYLDRRTFWNPMKNPIWKYGVETYDIARLAFCDISDVEGWVKLTWEDLFNHDTVVV